MPDRPSAVLLARLRKHCNGGYQGCPDCDPARGMYCPRAAMAAEVFAELRRREVLAWRLALPTGARA